MDGTDTLCEALYKRKAGVNDYIGGADAKMLTDAAAVIIRLEAESARARRAAAGYCEVMTWL